MILEVENIHTSYGLSRVLFGISLHVAQGEVVALLGRNGVGKTTTLRSIMGLTKPQSGSVRWKGKEIIGKEPFQIAQAGIGLVPEDRKIFSDLTVWENLDVAAKQIRTNSPQWTIERVFELFPALESLKSRRGGYLSGGEQQMLAIGRALLANPRLLIMDEPTTALDVTIQAQILDLMRELNEDTGAAVIWRPAHAWDVAFGYRYFTRQIETDAFFNKVNYNIPFLAIERFW